MIVIYIGCGTGDNPLLGQASEKLRDERISVDCFRYRSEELDRNERYFEDTINQVENADFIIVDLHGSAPYFKKFSRLLQTLRSHNRPAFITSTIPEEMEEYRPLFQEGDEDYQLVHSYLHLGGDQNMRSLLLWVYVRIGGGSHQLPKPVSLPTHGIYHPGWQLGVTLSEYRLFMSKKKFKAGILFWQGQYLSKSLDPVDKIIGALEQEGFDTIPVYCSSTPDPVSGSPGIEGIINQYFKKKGTPIIDVLIVMMGFSQISFSSRGCGADGVLPHNFFSDLNVPVLQVMTTNQSREEWEKNISGLSPMEISSHVVWPEYDGQIITIPVATHEQEDTTRVVKGLDERIENLAKTAKSWAVLQKTPVRDRRIAFLLYQYGLEQDCIGGAFGLDSPESLVRMLHSLHDAGYTCGDTLPSSGQELIGMLLSGLTNTPESLSDEEMIEKSAGVVLPSMYQEWFAQLPPECSQKMVRDWGEPPGPILARKNTSLIPGIEFGNIFVGIQPPRGFLEEVEAIYHSTDLVMPHQYLAYYRWLKEEFKAQALVHIGTHGTLEWLPGKSVGLSGSCYPDLMLEDIPHLYPYIIDNPGEGIQAKRRSKAVILDHLIPSMTRAGGYGPLEELFCLIQEYFRAEKNRDDAKIAPLLDEIHALIQETDLSSDLNISALEPGDIRVHIEEIHDYLCSARDSLIKDGLHIFGSAPKDERYTEMLYALTRLKNGSVPSLRESIALSMGIRISDLVENPSGWNDLHEKSNGALLDDIDLCAFDIIRKISDTESTHDLGFNLPAGVAPAPELIETIREITTRIVPNLLKTTDEMDHLLAGLDGRYIPPGPSGPPTRGNAHLLPTGRNFYSVDPAVIPTPAAFAIGKSMADQMIERYIRDEGVYPQNVGIVIFATDSMKTGGDDIAYLLWLMGLRPAWSAYGSRVTGLEVIPAAELNRPRIDVTLRISGLFRDVFPGLIDLIDEGVEMVATLDESDENNFLASHLRRSIVDSIKEGMSADEAKSRGLIRIFGCPPGTYGAGVADKVASSRWEGRKDLADTFIDWGGHAYGRRYKGEEMKDLFRERLAGLDVTVKNHSSRELDILDNDDDFMYHGGMVAVTKEYGEKDPTSYVGDSSDPDNTVLRTVAEESKFLFRSRILNPKWLEGLKPHRYRGAQELASLIDFAFGWDATSDILEDWQYQSLAETFLFNEECKRWLQEDNPYALRHMSGRLLEAVNRGMWTPDTETMEKLKMLYLSIETVLEARSDPGVTLTNQNMRI